MSILSKGLDMGKVHDNRPLMAEESSKISSYRYGRGIKHITLLRVMQEIDNNEVKRLINLLESPDSENWTVAEECIKQKLS